MALFGRRFRDLEAEFLASQRLYSDDRTTCASNMRILIRHLGDRRLSEITPPAIEDMMAARLAEGVSRCTCNRQRATLSRFFSWAISRGYHRGRNPVKDVKPFHESHGRTRYLSQDEEGRLLLACPPHLRRIVLMALHTGGRRGELLKLRWQDIDLDRGVVTFRRETTKSKRERMVPLTPEALAMLRDLWPRRPTEPVFTYEEHGLRTVRRSFARACRKAGIVGLHLHDLRHTFAAVFVMNGGDLYRLQRYMGHSTIALTQRYAHLSRDYLLDGVRFIGSRDRKARSEADET